MTWFIDRRLNGKNKSTVNRQRFLRRYKAQIKQSISEAINKRSVTDVDSGESVSIPTDDISEPMFHQGRGGLRHRVHPGNDHFIQNDRIERPQGGGGGGSGSGQGQASQDGEGQDEFVFQISKDEYLDLLFEDLALPNLKKNQHRQLNEYKTHRAGFTSNGTGQYQRGTFATKLSGAPYSNDGRKTPRTARAGNGTGDHQQKRTSATA